MLQIVTSFVTMSTVLLQYICEVSVRLAIGDTHKWRAGASPEDVETTSTDTNQNSPKPHDTARPSSCHCYPTPFSNIYAALIRLRFFRSTLC